MRTDIKRICGGLISLFIFVTSVIHGASLRAYAETTRDDPMIVVSMGDSYSSGEGVEPFYGQDSNVVHKTASNDWLAHRSEKSWPSKLVVPGYEGKSGDKTMKDYKTGFDFLSHEIGDIYQDLMNNCEWFFVASSGAVTADINSTEQVKTVRQSDVYNHKKFTRNLPKQLDVFKDIQGTVDFVTITIGGNDVDFAEIITTCAMKSTYLGSKKLEKQIGLLWDNFGTTRANIKQTYKDISKAAPKANIIVADYPQLLDPSGKGLVISKEEARLVNNNVKKFNTELENIVEECSNEGVTIHFVDVQDEFQGHEAYSNDPWINKIILGHEKEELDDKAVSSAYSVHPNEKGTDAYAKCVNEKIASLCGIDWYSYIEKELAPEYGYADMEPVSLTISSGIYAGNEVVWDGIVAADIIDMTGDGNDDLLLYRFVKPPEPYNTSELLVDLYTAVGNEVHRINEINISTDELSAGIRGYTSLKTGIIQVNDAQYLWVEKCSNAYFANGMALDARFYGWDDSQLRRVWMNGKLYGGSSGIVYGLRSYTSEEQFSEEFFYEQNGSHFSFYPEDREKLREEVANEHDAVTIGYRRLGLPDPTDTTFVNSVGGSGSDIVFPSYWSTDVVKQSLDVNVSGPVYKTKQIIYSVTDYTSLLEHVSPGE